MVVPVPAGGAGVGVEVDVDEGASGYDGVVEEGQLPLQRHRLACVRPTPNPTASPMTMRTMMEMKMRGLGRRHQGRMG